MDYIILSIVFGIAMIVLVVLAIVAFSKKGEELYGSSWNKDMGWVFLVSAFVFLVTTIGFIIDGVRTLSYDSHCDTCICESCCNAREETAPDGFILVHVNGKAKSVNIDSIIGIETEKDWNGYSVRIELQGKANSIHPDESYDEIVELINNAKVVKGIEL